MSLCINPYCSGGNNHHDMRFCQTCGSELLLQGCYRVKNQLGGGGFGRTYELTDSTGKSKVLKLLVEDHPKAVELFQREAEVLKVLNHPGIPRVEENGYFVYFPRNSQKHLHCLVMEKIEGLNLYDYIQQQGNKPIEPELAINWLRELTIILQEVHKQNFFHRDIKPSNIMLRTDGRLVLIDFGTVRQVTKTYVIKQAAGDITGVVSSGYTPLEQINGQAVQQSDFFALGRTFVYLLTGKPPSQLYNPLTNILEWRDLVPAISPKFADLLDEMMSHTTSQRPENTQIILQKLGKTDTVLPSFINLKKVKNNVVNKVPQTTANIRYANVWMRFFANLIDFVFLFLCVVTFLFILVLCLSFIERYVLIDIVPGNPLCLFSFFLGPIVALGLILGSLYIIPIRIGVMDVTYLMIGMIINYLYFTLFESSVRQGTPGMYLLDIRVTDLNQEKISFVQANIRYWSKSISMLLFTVGFLIAAFTRKRQGLHDMIAKTIVIKKKNSNN